MHDFVGAGALLPRMAADADKSLPPPRGAPPGRENLVGKLEQFSAIATRYDKTARNSIAAVYLAAATTRLN